MPNIIYARRSSEGGDDFSLDTQVEACKKHAHGHGLGECEVITEHFTGTKHLRDRGADTGARLWRMIESGQVSNLIVYSADRLSRAPLRHALQQIDEIIEAGVRLHTTDSGEITSSDSIDIVFKSWMSAQERAAIVDRFTRGKRGKARSGKWVGAGPAPYGFRRVGQRREAKLEHDPDEIAVLQLMIDFYLGDPPRSLNALRDELFKRGIPSPGGRAVWATSRISRVLSSLALVGRFTYGDLTVELPDLAIIDQKTWNAIQGRMESNRQLARRNRKRDYLLTTRLKCICGRAMTARPQIRHGHPYSYYTCASQSIHHSERTCSVHHLPQARIEAAVWQWVLEHTSDDMLHAGIEELNAAERAQAVDPRQLERIDAEIKRLQGHIRALLAQAKETDRPAIIAARDDQLDEDGSRIEKLIIERGELSTALERAETRAAERADIVQRIAGLRGKLHNADAAQKAAVIKVIDVRVKLLERTYKSKHIKVSISSEIAPPQELAI